MKRPVSLIVSLMLFISNTNAQGFRGRMRHRPAISPVTIVGISTASIGCGALAVGFLYYSFFGDTSSSTGSATPSNDGIKVMEAGAGLLALGGILIIAGVSNDRQKKLAIIAPKRNEIGLAYNFK